MCGPSAKETVERYRALIEGGLVVQGKASDEMVKCSTCEEAAHVRKKNPLKASTFDMIKDSLQSFWL